MLPKFPGKRSSTHFHKVAVMVRDTPSGTEELLKIRILAAASVQHTAVNCGGDACLRKLDWYREVVHN